MGKKKKNEKNKGNKRERSRKERKKEKRKGKKERRKCDSAGKNDGSNERYDDSTGRCDDWPLPESEGEKEWTYKNDDLESE